MAIFVTFIELQVHKYFLGKGGASALSYPLQWAPMIIGIV